MQTTYAALKGRSSTALVLLPPRWQWLFHARWQRLLHCAGYCFRRAGNGSCTAPVIAFAALAMALALRRLLLSLRWQRLFHCAGKRCFTPLVTLWSFSGGREPAFGRSSTSETIYPLHF
jgi:hypothetical protein